jgi:Flp pilus assembly protein TadB
MARPGDEIATAVGRRGRLRASHADREQVIDALKAAFVQGQLDKDELDARVGHAFASRTYAELAALTADIPGPVASPPPRRAARAQARPRVHTSIKAGVCAIVAATMLEALSLGATWPETMLAIFAALVFGVIVAGIVALPIAGVLMLESRHRKRSGRQLPATDPLTRRLTHH